MQTVKSGNRALNQQCPLHKIHKEQGRAKTRTPSMVDKELELK